MRGTADPHGLVADVTPPPEFQVRRLQQRRALCRQPCGIHAGLGKAQQRHKALRNATWGLRARRMKSRAMPSGRY